MALSVPALVLALAGSALAADPQVPLSQPVPASIRQATLVGRLPATTVLNMSLSLAPVNPGGMQAYADRVSDPHDPYFRRFLTPVEIGTRFGAAKSTVDATVAYLRSKGMTITLISDNRLSVLFKSTAAQAEKAFGVTLNRYRNTDPQSPLAKDFYYYTTVPKLPQSIAAKTVSLGGLETYHRGVGDSTLKPVQAQNLYDIAGIYGGSTTGTPYKGAGVNIGISNQDGYSLSNLSQYYAAFGLPFASGSSGPNVTQILVNGVRFEGTAGAGEGDLDLQMVAAMAPQSHIYMYDGLDWVSIYSRELNDNLVDVVTESYSHYLDESTYQETLSLHNLHVAMTVQGITYCDSSGDYGTDLTRGLGAPYYFGYPRIEPEIVNVGGTVATVDALGGRIAEEGWTGSGSGYSDFDIPFNVRPSWQVGTTVPGSPNRRLFPDVAVHAHGRNVSFANTTNDSNDYGWYVYIDGGLTVSSGTSASSPSFAGMLGTMLSYLKSQDAVDPSPSGRYRLGRINDFLYQLDGDSSVFFDPLVGDSGALPNGEEAVCKVGWDYVTGWGAPKMGGLSDAFLSLGSLAVLDQASAASIYIATPTTFGQSPEGSSGDLANTDDINYSVLSVKQAGVGQVAAATLDFTFQGDESKRRSASLNLAFSSDRLTTDFVYLYNYTTSQYDLVKTVSATGSMTTVPVPINLTTQTQDGNVRVLVRALKPTRLGNVPFRLKVDQATVTERVARN